MGVRVPHALISAALALLVPLLSATPASADLFFGPAGSGAGQTVSPRGVAVDTSVGEPTSGRVYVADLGNSRVSVFDSAGAFLFAFGWKVNATAPEEKLQICTSVTGCQAGAAGTGAGQFKFSPERLAVDPVSHAVYVSENENHRVQKFDADGNFLFMLGGEVNKTAVEEGRLAELNICPAPGHPSDVCQAGKVGGEEGQFLATLGAGLPIAFGPGGALYVADSKQLGPIDSEGFNIRIQKFTPSGAYIGPQLLLADTVGRVQDIAVEPSGDIYVGVDDGAYKYHPDGTPYGAPYPLASTATDINALELDASGNLFITDQDSLSGFGGLPIIGIGVIAEYDSTGTQLRSIYGAGPLKVSGRGLAVHHTAAGDLFVSQSGTPGDGIHHIPFPSPGPLILPNFTEATEIGNSKATLKAAINPEGKATEVAFQYVDEATFQADQPNGFANAQQTPFEAIPGPGGSSFELQEVTRKLPVETLVPETKYHVRAIARNADAPAGNPGPEGTPFTTLGPPEVLDTWTTDVGSDSARLHGEADPLLLATTGYFQYVDEATYDADVQALGPGHGFDHAKTAPDVGSGSAPLDFGSGEGGIERSASAFPLEPGTTYRYRLVLEGVFDPIFGPERQLRTFALTGPNQTECPNQAFRTGASAPLPDCRAYEMVSPLDKNNGDIFTRINLTGYPTNLDQSAVDGSGFTYSSYRAFANPQSAPFTNQYLATRDPDAGWLSESIDPPQGGGAFRLDLENEYKAFLPDLSQAWMRQEAEPPLDPCAAAGFAGLYRRESASGAFQALSCAEPNLKTDPTVFMPELQGFSADGEEAVFRIDDALAVSEGPQPSSATTGVGGGVRPIYQVYLSSGEGELRLLNVLPNGEASEKDSSAGTAIEASVANHHRFQSVDNAISEDGTRVFWTAGTGSGQIYLRLNATSEPSLSGACDEAGKACTIAISGSVSAEPAFFQKANPQGTKALFTVRAGPLKDNLYSYDVATEEPQLIGEGTDGSILGASEDLARVYFVSTKASAQAQTEGALEGKPNVYLYDEGTTSFVATLSSPGPGNPYPDVSNLYGTPTNTSPIERTARVSPDGQSLVFMSNSRALSEASAGYDNTDAANGQPDSEVYLYSATADGGLGKLRCVSCNPSGERPRGRELIRGLNGKVGPYGAATIPLYETQFYQPRYLSDDGKRVFFNSFEALVIGDTNGKQDVYQWEAPGAGTCTTDSPSYISTSEGCLSLISSGQSSSDSKFHDASASGSDVFFTTVEDLLPQDFGLVDVYDARAGGGLPPPPSPPPACEGDACQSPASPPNDPTPASASFAGAGDPITKGRRSSRCPAGKRKVRKAGRSRCVKAQKAKGKQRNRKHSNKGRTGR